MKSSHTIHESTENFSPPKRTLDFSCPFALCSYDTDIFLQRVNYLGKYICVKIA